MTSGYTEGGHQRLEELIINILFISRPIIAFLSLM